MATDRRHEPRNAVYCNLFGVVVFDAPFQQPPAQQPPPFKIRSNTIYRAIQDAVGDDTTGAHRTIADALSSANNKKLFQKSFLPLVEHFGSKGGKQSVLELFNSDLTRPIVRPGVVGVSFDLLDLLLPSRLLRVFVDSDLPSSLRGFFDFMTFGLLFPNRRGLTKAEVPHLKLVHYLARFDWSERVPARSGRQHQAEDYEDYDDWQSSFAEELYRYYVDLFAGKFIYRNGNLIKFDLAPSDLPDAKKLPQTIETRSPAVAGELVSVLVEYLGDKAFQVPFYYTGNQRPPNYPCTCYRAGVITTLLDDIKTQTGKNESTLGGKIIASACSAAQKQVACAVGGLVRGGGIAAVNNEVVAEIVSSLFGSLAKKFVEIASYEILKSVFAEIDETTDEGKAIFGALHYIYGV